MELGHIIPFILVAIVIMTVGYQYVMRNRKPAVVDTLGAAPASKDKDKKPGYLSKVRGSMNPVTFFGILVIITIFLIFTLIPGDVVAYFGWILMTVLMIMIILSVVMWLTHWGNRWVWFALFIGFIWLSYNPPETTADLMAQGYESVTKEGLKGVAPRVTPMVPDIIYMSPEEKAAARKAEAAQRAIDAEIEKQRVINEAVAQAAAEAEAAKYRPLTTDAFMTKTIGTFEPLQIRSGQRVGPINFYKDTCFYWSKSGMGMFFVYSRTDFASEPVLAEFQNHGYGIKSWNQPSAPVQVFLEAKNGDIQIELERREGSNSCK